MPVSGRLRVRIPPVLSALLILCLPLTPVYAHAAYERSEPGDGAIVATQPERVSIWFTQELFRRAGENRIEVEDSTGRAVHSGEAVVDDDNRTLLSVGLSSPLSPGIYRVRWRTLSAEDGDTEEGEFSFEYDPQVAATSTPMQAATAVPSITPTLVSAIATTAVEPSPTPTEAGNDGCALGLIPAFGLALAAVRTEYRRRLNS